jgi:hypothetical protein
MLEKLSEIKIIRIDAVVGNFQTLNKDCKRIFSGCSMEAKDWVQTKDWVQPLLEISP